MRQPSSGAERDLVSLATAPMVELLEALEAEGDERPRAEEPIQAPARALQISRFVVTEAVRLIRVGTRPEVMGAAEGAARIVARSTGEELEDRHPEAFRLLEGAAVVLEAASSPASGAGELSVLRSWNHNAAKAVLHVSRAVSYEMPRARLRERLGVEESYMSHMLADLEAAGLLVRRRYGREVTVYLGPTGHSDRVQDELRKIEPHRPDEGGGRVGDDEAVEMLNLLSSWGQPAEEDRQVLINSFTDSTLVSLHGSLPKSEGRLYSEPGIQVDLLTSSPWRDKKLISRLPSSRLRIGDD